MSICRECEVAVSEGVDQIWALQRRCRLYWCVLLVERPAREETDRLRYGRLEEAAELRMRLSMCRENLPEGEEC